MKINKRKIENSRIKKEKHKEEVVMGKYGMLKWIRKRRGKAEISMERNGGSWCENKVVNGILMFKNYSSLTWKYSNSFRNY